MRLWDFENRRNTDNAALFEAMIREAYSDVTKVAAAHHLFFQRSDGPPEEIPSADALMFDHHIASRIWGEGYRMVLARLAMEPVATRDLLLHKLYYEGKPA